MATDATENAIEATEELLNENPVVYDSVEPTNFADVDVVVFIDEPLIAGDVFKIVADHDDLDVVGVRENEKAAENEESMSYVQLRYQGGE